MIYIKNFFKGLKLISYKEETWKMSSQSLLKISGAAIHRAPYKDKENMKKRKSKKISNFLWQLSTLERTNFPLERTKV